MSGNYHSKGHLRSQARAGSNRTSCTRFGDHKHDIGHLCNKPVSAAMPIKVLTGTKEGTIQKLSWTTDSHQRLCVASLKYCRKRVASATCLEEAGAQGNALEELVEGERSQQRLDGAGRVGHTQCNANEH